MIREERDPGFWEAVASHPAVGPHMGGRVDWAALVGNPAIMPFACEGGGYIIARLDALGRAWDLHAAFRPEGWGRTANAALKAALNRLGPWAIITATEVEGNWRSRPPRSFGFRPAEAGRDGYRTWVLTREAWERSPAKRRTE